jgi:hypothetical protein
MIRSINKATVVAVLSAAGIVAAAPALWLARADSTRANSTRADGTRAGASADRRPSAPDRPRGPRPAEQRPVSAAEWADVSEFMADYMPWRIEQVRQMPEGPVKERVKRLLAFRYRGLRALQNRDADSYEQRLGQLKIEDQIYKLVSEMPGADGDRRKAIRDELRTHVARLVEVDIQERQRRVERLEDELARQKRLLDQDTKDRNAVVERRLGRFLDWGSRWPAQQAPGKGGADGKPDGSGDGEPAAKSGGADANRQERK